MSSLMLLLESLEVAVLSCKKNIKGQEKPDSFFSQKLNGRQ